ncbi:thermonuclease family protein [Qipengyuania citrea]|uniref:thermonuclease family protein n=1 Tax=Qipengyuania citrea TaxID=225971 RepID=UPI003297EF2A
MFTLPLAVMLAGCTPPPLPPEEPLAGCSVSDGDTIRCGSERIRLLGIDAPELPGHCRQGRACAPGDPFASTASLDAAMSGSLGIRRFGQDRYGRTLAMVSAGGDDLSCHQLATGHAIYKSDWDDLSAIIRTCPDAVAAAADLTR